MFHKIYCLQIQNIIYVIVAYPSRSSESLIRVAYPSRLSESGGSAIAPWAEEGLYQAFDFLIKAGISCMIMHTSIKTVAQRQVCVCVCVCVCVRGPGYYTWILDSDNPSRVLGAPEEAASIRVPNPSH